MNAKIQSKRGVASGFKANLTFFNNKVTELNNQRLQLNRSKGIAKYFAKPHTNPRNLTPMENSMGVLSFSLYILRFSANMALLIELIRTNSSEKVDKERRDIYYNLLNDSLWGVINLAQFFWLSFSNSESAGYYGLKLEVIAQLIDVLVMVIRFLEAKQEYQAKYIQASEQERKHLDIEWQNKERHFIRSLITALSIVLVLGLLAFSVAAVPVSPILSSILLLSSLLKVLFDWSLDKQRIQQMKADGVNCEQVVISERTMTLARLKDCNKLVLNHVMMPVGLFLFITSPLSLFAASVITMIIIHYGTSSFIESSYEDRGNLECRLMSL